MGKTVAFFNGFYLPHLGGVENYTYHLGQKLREKGYRVIVVTTQHDIALKTSEIKDGIKVFRLPVYNIWRQRSPFLKKNSVYHQLVKELQKEKIDYFVINTWFYQVSILGAKLASLQGVKPTVIGHMSTWLTLNNSIADVILHSIERKLIGKLKKYDSSFVGVSQAASEWLKEFGITAEGVLYNAVEESDYEKYFVKKVRDKDIIITFSGRLEKNLKGVEILLSVFKQLSNEYRNLKLIIAGDGPMYTELKNKYPDKNIEFLGRVENDAVMKVMNQSDIFVLLSKAEGFSTSLLEAGLMGNILITTNVGGAIEMIPTADFGYIIERDEKSLSETIREVMAMDRTFLDKMQNSISRRIYENFTWTKTTEVFINMIEKSENR